MNNRYIMITHFSGHWDKIRKNRTHYPLSMLYGTTKLIDNMPTTFVRINDESKEIEDSWEGTIKDVQHIRNEVWFTVSIEKKISKESVRDACQKYKREGCYFITEATTPEDDVLSPKFFDILRATTNWGEFENYVHSLIKLIGVNDLYPYEEQRGQADGFFFYGNLAVIYDATLEQDLSKKEVQIKNYCSQLGSGELTYEKEAFDVKKSKKHVWIVTRGTTRVIEIKNEIKVKEIAIESLFNLYRDRLTEHLDKEKVELRLLDL